MGTTPLDRLLASPGVTTLRTAEFDSFVAAPGRALLVYTGDPARRAEAQDIAVIVGEMARTGGNVRVGVVHAQDEDALKGRFSVGAVPALVFLVDGKMVKVLERLQDWSVYSRAAREAFAEAG